MALEHSGAIGSLLHMSNADFFLLEDLEVNCQIAEMKFALELRRAWLGHQDVLNTLGAEEFLAALRPRA